MARKPEFPEPFADPLLDLYHQVDGTLAPIEQPCRKRRKKAPK